MNLSEFRDGRVYVRNSGMKGLRENDSCEKEKAPLISRCYEIQIYWVFSEKKNVIDKFVVHVVTNILQK